MRLSDCLFIGLVSFFFVQLRNNCNFHYKYNYFVYINNWTIIEKYGTQVNQKMFVAHTIISLRFDLGAYLITNYLQSAIYKYNVGMLFR